MMTTLSMPIAQGRTAEIYAWDEQHILKLYRDWCPSDWVGYEAQIARAVYDAGIPSPAAGDIIEINGRQGLIYERIEGISMLQDMNIRPWMVPKHARWLADLHVKVNQKSIPGLPIYKDHLAYDIAHTKYLSDDQRQKLISVLKALPDRQNLCHGDYHPGNVLITKDGPIIIDWMTACSGSPWVDVARSSMILSVGAKGAKNLIHPMIRIVISLFHRTYLDRYRSQVGDEENELERWRVVVAGARLIEEIEPEREELINRVNKYESH